MNKKITSRFKLAVFTAITLLISLQSMAIGLNEPANEIAYVVNIDESNHKVAKVTATFIPQDNRLYMFAGANRLPKHWATFVSDLTAKDHNNQSIKVIGLDDGSWSLERIDNSPVTISYQLNLDHEKYQWSGGVDGAAYAKDWGVFYTGRALFIANGKDSNNIKVTFNLSKNWRVATPWVATKDNSFKVSNFTDLSSSVLFAGVYKEISVQRGEYELVLVLGGDNLMARGDEFKQLAEGVYDYYVNLMGGSPRLPADNKSTKSLVVLNPADTSDGEALGNNISILLKEGGQMDEMIARFIFAHEFFHLWNGKSFMPENDRLEWLKEGFSNYYTLKALHHVGFLTDDSYLGVLADFFYQKYDSDDGVGKLSMTAGEEKHDHWGLVYAGGFFVGLSQDMVIRSATNNQKSLDDLMRTLFNKYGGTDKAYSFDEIATELSKLAKADQTAFIDTYIKGVTRVPLVKYLSMAGIQSTSKNNKLQLSKNKQMTASQQALLQGMFGKL